MLIKRIYIYLKGDHSVGIGDSSAVIEADGDFLIDTDTMDDNVGDYLSEVRSSLANTFKIMWGEKPQVNFDFELYTNHTH